MGRAKHYSIETQDRIIHLLISYRSLPQAVRELGGQPSERTCRRWIARGGYFAKGYRQFNGYWELFRMSRGMERFFNQHRAGGNHATREHFKAMREIEAEIRNGRAE